MLDLGDAPDPYPTLQTDEGASHVAIGPTLGRLRDVESDGQPHPQAKGDDAEEPPLKIDDEDGLVRVALFRGCTSFLTIKVQGVSDEHFVNAWIDFDGDGRWGFVQNQVAENFPVTENGTHTIFFRIPEIVFSPVLDIMFARIRLSSTADLAPTGAAADGEVEDYRVRISVGPSQVFVDDDWAGTPLGADPDGAGPASFFGLDAFAEIQPAIDCVAPSGLVHVFEGDYPGSVSIIKPLTLEGDGASETSISETILVKASPVTLRDFTFTKGISSKEPELFLTVNRLVSDPNGTKSGLIITKPAAGLLTLEDVEFNGSRGEGSPCASEMAEADLMSKSSTARLAIITCSASWLRSTWRGSMR